MRKIWNLLILFVVSMVSVSAFMSCADDKGDDWGTYLYHPINIVATVDTATNMVTYTWDDRLETPSVGYYVTTYKGTVAENHPLEEVGTVPREEGKTSYSYSMSTKLLSGTSYEVEIRGYEGDVLGYPGTATFESLLMPNVVGEDNKKVNVTANTATFTWLSAYLAVPKKVVVTPNEADLNSDSEEVAIVVEQAIDNPERPMVTVEGLVSNTGYTAALFDEEGGIVGKYAFKTALSGGFYVYNSEELQNAIDSMRTDGGAIMISTKEVGPDYVFEYSGEVPMGDFYLMGSDDYASNPDSTATIKLNITYPDNAGQLTIMRLNIDGKNEVDNFITLAQRENVSNMVQGDYALCSGITISDCVIANYKVSFLSSGLQSYQQLKNVTVENSTIANFPHGSLIDFRLWNDATGGVYGSAVKTTTFENSTIYNVANDGTPSAGPDAEGKYKPGTSLIRIDNVKDSNNTLGSLLKLTKCTIIDVALNAGVFNVTCSNYDGKQNGNNLEVKDCLYANMDITSYSTNVGQVKNGYKFNPATNEAADAISMTTRTSEAVNYGANSNTSNSPMCAPVVSVTFADLANLDFTIVGGTATKGNQNLYQ